MAMDRIIKALTFKREVYSEVEHDASFTISAWTIVAVAAFLNQLGANADMGGFGGWITASLIGTVIAVAGFALAAFVISWAGKQLFQAEVSFEEIVRSVGLAYV